MKLIVNSDYRSAMCIRYIFSWDRQLNLALSTVYEPMSLVCARVCVCVASPDILLFLVQINWISHEFNFSIYVYNMILLRTELIEAGFFKPTKMTSASSCFQHVLFSPSFYSFVFSARTCLLVFCGWSHDTTRTAKMPKQCRYVASIYQFPLIKWVLSIKLNYIRWINDERWPFRVRFDFRSFRQHSFWI